MPAVDDLTLLVEAAQEAGEIAQRYWRREPRAWDKGGDAGPVTEADLAVNDYLSATLRGARPDYGWLSEESPDEPSRLDARRVFIIDPIDGTRAFIDGQDGFSHSLAVAEGDRIVAAVVFLPVRGAMYAASASGPALLNGKPIAPNDPSLDQAQVLTNRASLDAVFWRGRSVPPFKRAFRPSLAWRFCLVAEGRFDAALSVRAAWEWDIAAGALIAARAGATVTDVKGAPMRFNNPGARVDGLLVAGPDLHQQIVTRLAPLP